MYLFAKGMSQSLSNHEIIKCQPLVWLHADNLQFPQLACALLVKPHYEPETPNPLCKKKIHYVMSSKLSYLTTKQSKCLIYKYIKECFS